MKLVSRFILKQKEIVMVLSANDVRGSNTIGFLLEININVKDVNIELLCAVAPYCMAHNYLIIIIGILQYSCTSVFLP